MSLTKNSMTLRGGGVICQRHNDANFSKNRLYKPPYVKASLQVINKSIHVSIVADRRGKVQLLAT